MKTAICIASGPSLIQEDVDYCQGKGCVYVINDSYRLAPWADVLYACDGDWWKHHNGVPDFQGKKFTINEQAAIQFGLHSMKILKNGMWSDEADSVATGGNSGYQALNLAVLHGAKKVVLLGYDMQLGKNKLRHWFGDHPGSLNKSSNYQKWIENFAKAVPYITAAGVEVVNCTRDSALACFKKSNLRDEL